MSQLAATFLLVVLASHTCLGVILRPNWYPYFRRNQTAQRRYASDRSFEASGVRQTRSGVAFDTEATKTNDNNIMNVNTVNTINRIHNLRQSAEYPCKDGISLVNCLIRLLNIVERAVKPDGF